MAASITVFSAAAKKNLPSCFFDAPHYNIAAPESKA
jgi:hypothetical protein